MGSIDKACISGFLCRLCSEMHRIVIHIYGDQGQRLCLVEKINGYLPITISPNDPLPKTICGTCLRRVEQHYDLLMRLSRIKEDRFLRMKSYRLMREQMRMHQVSDPEDSEDEDTDDENRAESATISVTASTSAAATAAETASTDVNRQASSSSINLAPFENSEAHD